MKLSDFKVDVQGDEDGQLTAVVFEPLPVFHWFRLVAARQQLDDALAPCFKLDMRLEASVREARSRVYKLVHDWIKEQWIVPHSRLDGSNFMKLYNVEE